MSAPYYNAPPKVASLPQYSMPTGQTVGSVPIGTSVEKTQITTVKPPPKDNSNLPHFIAAWGGVILAIIAIILAMIAIFMNPQPGKVRYWVETNISAGGSNIKIASQTLYEVKQASRTANTLNFVSGKQGSYFFVFNDTNQELTLNYNGNRFAVLAPGVISGFLQVDSTRIIPIRTAE